MKVLNFGAFNDISAGSLIKVRGKRIGGAYVFPPSIKETNGRIVKHYPVKFSGSYKKLAPCTDLGIWGNASEVMKIIKAHMASVDAAVV